MEKIKVKLPESIDDLNDTLETLSAEHGEDFLQFADVIKDECYDEEGKLVKNEFEVELPEQEEIVEVEDKDKPDSDFVNDMLKS